MSIRDQHNALLATGQNSSVIRVLQATSYRQRTYCPFGHDAMELQGPVAGFNGQARESVMAVYLLGNGYRAFNTQLRRFHSPDSLSPFDEGGLNAYAYCFGDPIGLVDPDGHAPWKPFAYLRKLFRRSPATTSTAADAAASGATNPILPAAGKKAARAARNTQKRQREELALANKLDIEETKKLLPRPSSDPQTRQVQVNMAKRGMASDKKRARTFIDLVKRNQAAGPHSLTTNVPTRDLVNYRATNGYILNRRGVQDHSTLVRNP